MCPKLYFYKRPSTASSAAYYFFYFYLSKALLGSSTRWQKQIFFIRPQHGGRDPLGKDQNEMPSNRGNIISMGSIRNIFLIIFVRWPTLPPQPLITRFDQNPDDRPTRGHPFWRKREGGPKWAIIRLKDSLPRLPPRKLAPASLAPSTRIHTLQNHIPAI